MVKQTVTGEIGEATVTVVIESDDEQLADHIYADLKGRAEEIRQMVEDGKHPDATRPPVRVDWENLHHGAYSK